jgi:signal transduction histidine kinase
MRNQLRIQWKFTLLVAFLLIGTLAVLVWKTRDILIKDKTEFLADSSMKQIAPLKRLVQDHLEERKVRLVKFAGSHLSVAASKIRPFGDFDVIALVQPQAPAVGTEVGTAARNGQWVPSWVETNHAPAKATPWVDGFATTLLKSLPYNKVQDGEVVFARVSDQQGLPVYAVLVSVEIQNAQAANSLAASTLPEGTDYVAAQRENAKRGVIVGFSVNDPLMDVTEEYIGSTSTVFLVDDKGYVASHVNKAYLGALFSEDPIVHEILTTKKNSATGNYDDLEGRSVQGHFVRIDHTNLYAVITTPLQAVSDLANTYTQTALLVGGVAMVFALLLAFLFGRSISEPLIEAAAGIRALNRGEAFAFRSSLRKDELGNLLRLLSESSPVALTSKAAWVQQPLVSKNSASVATEPDTQTTSVSKVVATATSSGAAKASASHSLEALHEGFSSALKGPLMAILGHAQLAKAKSTENQVRAHSESIEREARRAKEILEQLQTWSDEPKDAKSDEKVALQGVLNEALLVRENLLKDKGIELVTDLHAVPLINGSQEKLQAAILNIIDNACEALQKRPRKQLKIQLDFLRDHIYLVFTDTGVGMSRDVKDHAFEPFFKAFESPDRIGLGLALVQKAVKLAGGTCHIESSPGEGAVITLKIPVSEEQRKAFQTGEEQKLSETVSQKFKPETATETPSPVAHVTDEPFSVGAEPGNFIAQSSDSRIDIAFDLSAAAGPGSDAANSGLSAYDDDDDEPFASVSLKKEFTPAAADALGKADGLLGVDPKNLQTTGEFHVKIRRPRARS